MTQLQCTYITTQCKLDCVAEHDVEILNRLLLDTCALEVKMTCSQYLQARHFAIIHTISQFKENE